MNKINIVLLASMALVVGLLLPIAVYYVTRTLIPVPGTSVTTQPVIHIGVSGERSSELNISITSEDLTRFSSYKDLYEYIKHALAMNNSIQALLTPNFSVVGRVLIGTSPPTIGILGPDSTIPEPVLAPSDTLKTELSEYSSTNIQVEGVDELDVVKTNGRIIAISVNNKVYLIDSKSKTVKSIVVLNETTKGLYLYGDRLAVISESVQAMGYVPDVDCKCFFIPPGYTRQVIHLLDISVVDQPRILASINVTGYLLGSRMSNNYIYLVVRVPVEKGIIPLINDRPIPLNTTLAITRIPTVYLVILVLDIETHNYMTYTFLADGGTWLYMSQRYLYIARENKPSVLDVYIRFINETMQYMPGEIKEKIVRDLTRGNIQEAWGTLERYLCSIDSNKRMDILEKVYRKIEEDIKFDSTLFRVFSVDGVKVDYRGSFIVEGELLDQFAMEEYREYFIVATTTNRYEFIIYENLPSTQTIKPISGSRIITVEERGSVGRRVYTIISDDGSQLSEQHSHSSIGLAVARTGAMSNNVYVIDLFNLEVIGRLEGLAPRERIYSARLIKHVFYMVTFREIDPLFAIDISDPRNPCVLGYLKIPGFSEYLHPLQGDRLLGIGLEDWSSLKISLFNITDPSGITEIAALKLHPGWSLALVDHHAVTVHYSRQLVIIPYHEWSGEEAEGILVVSYKNDILSLVKLITHQGVLRTLYIGSELFSVSTSSVKIVDLDTFNVIHEIILP